MHRNDIISLSLALLLISEYAKLQSLSLSVPPISTINLDGIHSGDYYGFVGVFNIVRVNRTEHSIEMSIPFASTPAIVSYIVSSMQNENEIIPTRIFWQRFGFRASKTDD